MKYFQYASDYNHSDTIISLYTGFSALQVKNNEIATKYFTRYLDQGGSDPSIFYTLATISRDKKDYATAIKVLQRGITANPEDEDLKNTVTNFYLESGDTSKAIENLTKQVAASPANTKYLLYLGKLYDTNHDKENALKYYQKVIDLDRDNFDCNYNLGVLHFNVAVELKNDVGKLDYKTYKKKGKELEDKTCSKFAEAKIYFDKCIAMEPNDQATNENIDKLQEILKICKER